MKKTTIIQGGPRSLRHAGDVGEAHRFASRLEGVVRNVGIKKKKKKKKNPVLF